MPGNLTISGGAVREVLGSQIADTSTVTVNAGGTLTSHAWDGTTGGVVAFKARGALTILGQVNASAIGFRGSSFSMMKWVVAPRCAAARIFGKSIIPSPGFAILPSAVMSFR